MATIVSPGKVKLADGTVVSGKEGGWYDGQQLFGGTLSAKGVINANSNQQGAGQAVSSEVNQASSIAQGKAPTAIDTYLAGGSGSPSFTSSNQAATAVNGAAKSLYNSSSDTPQVQSLGAIANDIKGLLPAGSAPIAPNLVQTYQDQRTSLGLDGLEKDIASLTDQENAIIADNRTRTASEMNKPEALGVIGGRVSEVQRQQNEKLDVITRQKTAKVAEYQAGLTNINTIMTLTQQDYTNAKASYDTQFTQAIDTINLVRGIQNDQKTDAQRAIDNSRANLQIYINTISNGNLDPKNLSPDQQLQINKMEVQSGLPVGFVSSLKMDPKANILFTNSDNGITQVGIKNADGTVSVQSYGTSTKTQSAADKTAALTSTYTSLLNSTVVKEGNQDYGHVSPESWRSAVSSWNAQGGSTEDFNKTFARYADPNRADFVQAYGFDLNGRTKYDEYGNPVK